MANEDLISRQAILDFVETNSVCGWVSEMPDSKWINFIKNLPSVQVPEKTGEWLMPDKEYDKKIWRKCSCCKRHIEAFSKYLSFNGDVNYIPYKLNYCYVCGAKMGETK